MSWKNLEGADPELAAFGASRFRSGVAYLATLRGDGAPRVHPVTPIVGEGRLFLFMEPTSPKGHDLRRDGRYALHSSVSGSSGASGEFLVSGQARVVSDPAERALAARQASYEPADRYILFELSAMSASSTVYNDTGEPIRRRWKTARRLRL